MYTGNYELEFMVLGIGFFFGLRMGRLVDRVVCERELEGTVKPANNLEKVWLVLGGEDAVPDEKVEQDEDAIGLKVALCKLMLDLTSHQRML